MKNLIEFILIHLVDHPEDVVIDETKGEQETTYLIHVHAEDVGRVIGKGGSVIQSIRQIARVRATKEGERVRIDVFTEDKAEDKTE
ncbi:KH domain-containing protein [Candidatus Woesebacteria bacterium]|nr:KH domain-containing protein [Candidatus Woesebacteria bacterium]